LATLALAQPIRPVISETFEGEGYQHVITQNETIWGIGHWVIDEPKNHGLEFWEFSSHHQHHNVHYLQRFDLGFEYAIYRERLPSPHSRCVKRAVKPPMPANWAWIKDAHYRGKKVIDEQTYDEWGHHIGPVELTVDVEERHASRPVYFSRRTPTEHRAYHLIIFATRHPNDTWFNVPDVCKNATEVSYSRDDSSCPVSVEAARELAVTGAAVDGTNAIVDSLDKAAVFVSTDLPTMRAQGRQCAGGPRPGDVFFDADRLAMYLGGRELADCSGPYCRVAPVEDFSAGFCRRFC